MIISWCPESIMFPKKGIYIVDHVPSEPSADNRDREMSSTTKKKDKKTKKHATSVFQGIEHKKLIIKILKVIYSLIGIAVILSTALLIGLTAIGAIVLRTYDHNESSRVASMIVVSFTAAVGVALAVYGITAAVKSSHHALHRISIAFIIMAVALLVLAVFAIHMTFRDEALVLQSLRKSFKLAVVHSPINVKQWDDTQNQLECCGIDGPEDYRRDRHPRSRSLVPPQIPSSCCVSFDPSLSELMQESMKQVCRRQHTYYSGGCREPVIAALTDASNLVYWLCVIVVVFFFVQGPLGLLLSNLLKKWRKELEQSVKPELMIIPKV